MASPDFVRILQRPGLRRLAAGAALAVGLWTLMAGSPPVLAPAVWHGAPSDAHVTAYVGADALDDLRAGMPARFYAAGDGHPYIPLYLVGIDSTAPRSVPDPDLAAPYGGPLAAGWDPGGVLRLDRPLYRVLLAGPPDAVGADRALGRVLFVDGPASKDAVGRPLSMR